MEQRQQVQEAFAKETRILISTDAGGEGLNLQFCHIVVNFDIPWNPMRIEQRIGRVDRIGQKSCCPRHQFSAGRQRGISRARRAGGQARRHP